MDATKANKSMQMENEKIEESAAMELENHRPADREIRQEEDEQVTQAGWLALFNFIRRSHIIIFVLAISLSVASGLIIPALAIFLGKIFDPFTSFGAGGIGGPDLVKRVSTYGIALVGLGSSSGILNALFFGFWLLFGELQAKSARETLFRAMLEKELEWYDMRKDGVEALIARQQTQIRELQLATSQPIGFALQYVVTTITALCLAFYYSWSLTLVTLATVPVAAIFLAWISRQMEPSIKAQNEELTKASKIATSAISAIDTVKCFNGQDYESWQYARSIKKAAGYYLSEVRSNASQIGFVRLMTLAMFVQGFWYGSHLVNTKQKKSGDILTAFWACLMAMQSFEQIMPQMVVLMKGRIAGETLRRMIIRIENGRKITKMLGGRSPSRCDGDIEVCNLSFSYPSRPDQPALKNASFLFPAGETTFIVGTSGSGKSTLGNLLLRFYEANAGEILIDCRSIQTLGHNWLRKNITLVQQQSILFDETLFKNIAFGREDHSTVRKGEISTSIQMALLRETINDLPKGLDTLVGTGGNALSGGQKQRVAIARAHLRDTPILILDEATSALDHVSKSLVVGNIRDWRRGKTTIIITHDMSQVGEGDYAYVLEDGAIVQQGFREKLEKNELGPFKKKPVSVVYPRTPLRSPIFDLESPQRSTFQVRTISDDSPEESSESNGSGIPSNTKPLLGSPGSRRSSQHVIRPLSPAAFPLHRSSFHSYMVDKSQRREWQRFQIQDSIEHRLQRKSIEQAVIHQDHLSRARKSSQLRPLSTSSLVQPSRSRRKRREAKVESELYVAPLRQILSTIWPTLDWRHLLVLLLGFVAATVHAAATPVFSFIFAKLLATFYLPDRSQRPHQALIWSMCVLGVAFADASASFSMHYLLESCGQAWIDALRREALKRILDQPRCWFDEDKNSQVKLIECLDRNAEEMRNLLGRFAGFVYVAVVMTSMAVIWSLSLSWKLTLVGLASGPYIYAVTRAFESVSGRWESRSNEAGSSTNSIFTETFSNIRTVRALTLDSYFQKKYTKAVSHALRVGLMRSLHSGLFFGLSDSGVIFATALIFYYGAVLASSHAYSVNDIMTVFTMLLFSIANANAIISFIPQINSSRATATRLLRLAHLPYRVSHEYTGHTRIADPTPLTLKNLTFTYPSRPSVPILRSLTLTLRPGTTTALVGASGSGKSTIAALLLALHPATTGSIKLSSQSHPLSNIHTPTLRSLIAIVPQQPTLFPATIRQNIAYALPEGSRFASLDSVRAAARAARIDAFITSLPDGYETLIGDGGTGLSGGQAQRIAIARAIVRRPRLLILDEATSGLDGETARGVRATMRELQGQGVGVLAITHDKEMMRWCGSVVVLREGRVVEEGGFEEVRGRRGELWRLLGGESAKEAEV